MPGSNEELKEILKSSVIQWNNGKKHCLAPTCTNRDDTEKKQKSFFEDPTIKIMCYGSTGGGRYSFYLFRDDDGRMYDIYKIPSYGETEQLFYVSHGY